MKQKLLKTWLVMLCMLVGIGSAWGEEVAYKTALFGSSYNSKGVSAYTEAFSATNNGFTVDLDNFNNNNNVWSYVKTGNKTNASVGTITTNAAIDKAITKVVVTIDAITASNVNSITLYSGTTASNCTTSEGTFSTSTGAQTVTISSPAANKFYKISFDCKKGSSNGLVTVSKVEYCIAEEGGTTPTTPTVTAPAFDVSAGTYTKDQLVLIDNYNSDYLYAYTLDGTDPAINAELNVTNGTEYDNDEGIEITSSCTLKVIAVDVDGNASSITSATYVINKPQVFASLEELVAADIATGTTVTVAFENKTIKSIYTSSQSKRQGIYFDIQKDGHDIEIYYNSEEVPAEWVAGGTLSGTMTCPWTYYERGTTWELAPASGWTWTNLTYTAPVQKTITALAVSGTPTKTTYNVGDKFDTTGLVVTATYSDDTTAPIAEGFEWEIDYGTGNEALVAGATSVDVMVYTDDQVMSKVYTVNGLTVNVPVTLTSIAVSGTPTKTAYYTGDAFETAGLVVTGTYSDGTTATITDGIEWTVDPETLTLGTTSVDVMAGVGTVVSEVYTVSGLTVTENPYKTATISSFSATSGDINADIAYEAFKGDASTAPAVNNNNLRLYQNGGYVTVKAIPGLKIASVKITTSATYESTTVGYCVDDEDAPTTGETVAKSSDYTISNLNNNSVSIYCLGTDKNTRLEIAAIEVKYAGTVVAELKSIELSGTYPTEFNKGAEFSHEGMTVTANYTDNSNADVTSNATFSGYDMNTLGEQTVTVSYTEDNITKTAEYTITVNKAPFVPTPAPAGYETVDFAALYSSVTTNATVEDYEGTSFAMAFAKPQSSSNPTKYYDNGKAVRAYEGNTITITGAEPITYVDIKWASGYADAAVSVTGIGTTTAVVTFSKTCRFTAITVDYRSFTVTTADTDFYSLYLNYAVTIPENVTAYTGKLNGNSLNLTKIEGGVIPAKTGVVFKTPESAGKAEFMPCADVDPFKDNDIQGVAQATPIDAVNTTGTILVLGMVNGKVGFALPAEGVTTLAANKAYIIVDPAAAAKGVSFVVDEATAINSVNTENNNSAVYNLAGQRVNANTKGIVIVNGKKMLNK